jgi:hypothetical protein
VEEEQEKKDNLSMRAVRSSFERPVKVEKFLHCSVVEQQWDERDETTA